MPLVDLVVPRLELTDVVLVLHGPTHRLPALEFVAIVVLSLPVHLLAEVVGAVVFLSNRVLLDIVRFGVAGHLALRGQFLGPGLDHGIFLFW